MKVRSTYGVSLRTVKMLCFGAFRSPHRLRGSAESRWLNHARRTLQIATNKQISLERNPEQAYNHFNTLAIVVPVGKGIIAWVPNL